MFDYEAAVQRCARGDREALKALFDEEAGRLVGVAQRIVRRRELAEEAVQDAFLQIWRKAASFDSAGGSARGWIYVIVRNRALNMIRDGAREDLADEQELTSAAERTAVAEDAFERLANDSMLKRCLEHLEHGKRTSILLAYVGGYSHGEIAGLLGVPVGTAKSWVRRGLLALRDCMI
jgi:RNA polymerase sigma-70 factor, ECF subfamily